jgi:hypothetical protein
MSTESERKRIIYLLTCDDDGDLALLHVYDEGDGGHVLEQEPDFAVDWPALARNLDELQRTILGMALYTFIVGHGGTARRIDL